MSIIKFQSDQLFASLGPGKPAPEPLGEPVSQISSVGQSPSSSPTTRVGVWKSSPGRWRRQVRQAEFCHFLEGNCTFHPDDGEPIEINAGDVIYFPAASGGIWDIRRDSRKIFIIFDEAKPA